MRHSSGGSLCIRLSFFLILVAVTIINLATLFSTDPRHFQLQRDDKLLHHLSRGSFQEKPPHIRSKTGSEFQVIPRIRPLSEESRYNNIKFNQQFREELGNFRRKSMENGLVFDTAKTKVKIPTLDSYADLIQFERKSGNQVSSGKRSALAASKNVKNDSILYRRFTIRSMEKLPNIVEHDLGIEDHLVEKNSLYTKMSSSIEIKSLVTRKEAIDIEDISKDLNKANESYEANQGKKMQRDMTLLKKARFIDMKDKSSYHEIITKRDYKVLDSVSNATQLSPSLINPLISNHKKDTVSGSAKHDRALSKKNLKKWYVSHRESMESNKVESPLTFKDTTSRGNISCKEAPRKLIGRIRPIMKRIDSSQLQDTFPWLSKGGHYTPSSCTPREKTAIIFPFRDRHRHLHTLLLNLLPVLKRQDVDFTLFVIEQEKRTLFNRGLLFNVGFMEALKLGDFDCFIFHDVDLIPLFDTNFYHCNESPTHFLGGVDKFKYGLSYKDLFGGVVSFTRSQYKRINGASNMYFGWGAEDDDMRIRIRQKNMEIVRTDKSVGLYDMIKHHREESNPTNPIRSWLLSSGAKRLAVDGLNTLEYQRISVQILPLYTWIKVQVDAYQTVMKSKFFTKDAEHKKMLDAFLPTIQRQKNIDG